jgi:hypothetical protein
MSDSYLHVYRISLPTVNRKQSTSQCIEDDPQVALDGHQRMEKTATNSKVWVLRETVLLPHSARHRSVQFFPAPAKESEGKAKVVIGPRYSKHPTPPIGVYLSEQDLGGWVDLTEKADDAGQVYESHKRLADQFEEGWEINDYILIPFDAE